MKPLDTDLLYYYHNFLTIIMVCLWIVFSFIGYKIQNKYIVYKITYGLIIFSVLQEILDYVNRIFLDELYVLSFKSDLPLQFCSIGYYFSLFGLIMVISDKNLIKNLSSLFLTVPMFWV